MSKSKHDYAQFYVQKKNEFIFEEKGGRGKKSSSLIKNNHSKSKSLSIDLDVTNSNKLKNIDQKVNQCDSLHTLNTDDFGYNSDNNQVPNEFINLSMNNMSTPFKKTNAFLTNKMLFFSRNVNCRNNEFFNKFESPTQKKNNSKIQLKNLDDEWDSKLDDFFTANLFNDKTIEDIINFKDIWELKKKKGFKNKELSTFLSDESFTSDPHVTAMDLNNRIFEFKEKKNNKPLNVENKSLQYESKHLKFKKILTNEPNININELRKLSWNGIPSEYRAFTWQILLDCIPTNKKRQYTILKQKRNEYLESINLLDFDFDNSSSNRPNVDLNREKQIYHQINIDVKRTHPKIKLYSQQRTQKSLKKILFLWAIRHPACGYVQGINDLCTPFFQIFLNDYILQLQKLRLKKIENKINDDSNYFIPGLIDESESDVLETNLINNPDLMNFTVNDFDPNLISERVINIIEADTFCCLSRLLDNITDNYVHQQPGIMRQINELRILISKIDIDLLKHLEREGIDFMQFSFRWMNCMLMREFSISLVIRMWDTYLSETPIGFNHFHIYVCAVFLIKFSTQLKKKDFQGILLFLQNIPTFEWKESDIELLLSEAFIWQSLYKNASAHLK